MLSLPRGLFAGAAVTSASSTHDLTFALISAGAAVIAAVLGPLVTDEVRSRRAARVTKPKKNPAKQEAELLVPWITERLEAQELKIKEDQTQHEKDQQTIANLKAELRLKNRKKPDDD